MESFSEVKSLWQTDRLQESASIDGIENVINKHQQYRKRSNYIVILITVVIIILSAIILSLAGYKLWSTYAGMLIFMLIALATLFSKMRTKQKITKYEELSNDEFLTELEKQENEGCDRRSLKQTLLFLIWGVGFSLYIFEFVSDNFAMMVSGYSSLSLYAIFIWFVYKPLMAKRLRRNIQNTIRSIHHLKSQMNEY